MKKIHIILLIVFLLASCSKENLTQPPKGMAEVTLGELRLSDTNTAFGADAATRAGMSNLPSGSQVRLYAFKKGVTDFNDQLSTRTYTINASGAAILDAGQELLYLPIGEVDIYLAGPLSRNVGTTTSPIWQDVADERGIYPAQGVDLIAAYTSTTINSGTINPLPTMTLSHKMAKVQVEVSRNKSGVYENLIVKDIKLYAQSQTGTYTLNTSGGVITPGVTSDFSYPVITTETLHEKYSGTALLIPQPMQELKIETLFECNQIGVDGDVHPTMRYRQSGIVTYSLDAGAATRFTAAPLTPIEIKWRVKVLPWDTVDQGTIVLPPNYKSLPPVSDALAICLDGYNQPTTIGGKLVWEDIGTTNNHAELMNNLVKWSNDGSYVFTQGGYMQLIKSLVATGVMPNSNSTITIELVFVPDNAQSSPNEGLLRLCNDFDAIPGDHIWKGNFSGTSGYFGQSEYASGRYRVTMEEANVAAGVTHSFVWANQRTRGTNFAYLDGIKYAGNGGSSAGYTWCIIGYAFYPTSTNRNYFSGKIKAVRIHTRILTDEEILKNYKFDRGYYEF